MAVLDDDLDPMEIQDIEEAEDKEDEHEASVPEDGSIAPLHPTLADPEHAIIDELDKIVEPEIISKNKANMLPKNLIEKDLEPEDWCDDGCI